MSRQTNPPLKNRKKLKVAVGSTAAAALLLSFVPTFEGMILKGYKDPIGIVTACAGHTATAVLGKPYTRQECEELLVEDLVDHADGVRSCIDAPLNPGQMAASVSFAYNVGVGAFCRSTMARMLNARRYDEACAQLDRWVYAGGKKLPGLVKRRAAERAICEGNY